MTFCFLKVMAGGVCGSLRPGFVCKLPRRARSDAPYVGLNLAETKLTIRPSYQTV